jgi:S1-C subfamily serine protease
MRRRTVIAGIVTLLLCAGCATPSSLMVNSEGRLYRCAASGWGWIGAPLADSIHDRCVSDFKKLGYWELPDRTTGMRLPLTAPFRVLSFEPNSSAASVGIQVGDVVTTVGDRPATTLRDIHDALKAGGVGDPIRVIVEREGKAIEFSPLLRER